MKMTNMKKNVFISSLALTMALTSTSFAMPRIYGEDAPSEVVSDKVKESEVIPKVPVVEKKALLTSAGKVTGRVGENDATDSQEITNLETITDLMIGDQVPSIDTNKFTGLKNITTLTFKAAIIEATPDGGTSKVTKIGANAFKGTKITTVVLPKNLITIEEGAFADIPTLTTVTFTNSTNVKDIQMGAFENSGLTTLDLSPMNTSTADRLNVGVKAFKGNTNLTTVTLSTKMKAFESEVFAATKIKAIEINEHITKIDTLAFKDTPLTNLTVNEANANFKAEENVLYNHDKTKLLLFPEGNAETEFTVPETVTTIEANAFRASPTLTKITTNAPLINIGEYAFDGATKLAKVILKDSLTQIAQYAFRGTALTTIALPNALVTIGDHAFAGATKLAKLDLRKATALTTVNANAFKDTALRFMVIGPHTGALNTITAEAFESTVTSKQVSFLDDEDTAISGTELIALVKKYTPLKDAANGAWKLQAKLSTPTATVDYDSMKLTGLVPSSSYTIKGKNYTTGSDGNIELLREWSNETITIMQNATSELDDSDVQEVHVEGIYTLTIDETKKSLKKAGTSVTAAAPEKKGYVFTTWSTTGITIPSNEKSITFDMPSTDVTLTAKYTEIIVQTPTKDLIFDGKNNVVVTIQSPFSNFKQLSVHNKDLLKDTNYTVSGTDTTKITLQKDYLDTLTTTTEFVATFIEGGDKQFDIRLYATAPTAVANYEEMKLTGLEVNTQYKINDEVKSTDAKGDIIIENVWSSKTLEIIKMATETETASKPQNLIMKTFYTIQVNEKEIRFTIAGANVTVKADSKDGYIFTKWITNDVVLNDASKEEITFMMPDSNVAFVTSYTPIIITKPENMVYDGTNTVTVQFAIPMDEFQNIEYHGENLVKGKEYSVASGSTIITFTKAFLDKLQEGRNGLKAVFLNNAVEFSIQLMSPAAPVVTPVLPEIDPTPSVLPAPAKTEIAKPYTSRPNTGDTTNIYLVFTAMLVSVGTVLLLVRKRNKQ